MPANEPDVIEDEADATKNIRVLCADDHPLILDGVARSLEREPDMLLVAEATDGLEAVEAFRLHKPDVALVDLQMPELNGIEVIRQILKMNPRARCIVLTTYRGDVQATRAFKAGAVGYLLKTMLRKELAQAIRTVHAGSRYVPNEIASELTRYFSADDLSARDSKNAEPLSAKLKFQLAIRVAIDPVTIGGVGFWGASSRQATLRITLRGPTGSDNASEPDAGWLHRHPFLGRPSLLHQDPRYFYQGSGTKSSRLRHALLSPFICRGDNGRSQVNVSSLRGDSVSSALAETYHPDSNRGLRFYLGTSQLGQENGC